MNAIAKHVVFVLGLATAWAPALQSQAGQYARADVYGVLQVGRQVHPTTIVQTGEANIVGVMQVGGNPGVAIRQSGQRNAAFVGQYESMLSAVRNGMP